MTPQVMQFVALQGSDGRTLEIGSMDVNGSLKNFFVDYVGLDMRRGINVDLVANGHALPFADNVFDRVVYLETMEHDKQFWKTFEESRRVLKPGGRFIVTTRGIGFMAHDFPHDYYRFTGQALMALMEINDFDEVEVLSETSDNGVFACARKKKQ